MDWRQLLDYIDFSNSTFLLDINECSEKTDNCETFCLNSDGSFSCYCNDGDVLANDASRCLSMLMLPFY